MSRQTFTISDHAFTVALDDTRAVAEHWSALVMGRVFDEETGRLAAGPLRGVTDRPGVTVRSSGDGAFCLVAQPWLACPPLLAPSYTVAFSLNVHGYLPVDLSVVVPSQHRQIVAPAPVLGGPVLALNTVAGLTAGQLLTIGPPATEERARIRLMGPGPQHVTLDGGLGLPHAIGDVVVADAWTPVDVGMVPLRRPPVVLRGRTVRRDAITNSSTPVPAATVTVTDFWTTLAAVRAALPGSMTDPNPATRAFIATISPGLVTSRDAGLGQVVRQDLVPTAAGDRRLVNAVAAGDHTIRVSDRTALAPGAVLRIDPGDPDRTELVTITAISGFGPLDQCGDAILALPLRAAHRLAAQAQPMLPQPAMPAVPLQRDARPGDRSVFVGSLAVLPDDVDVQLTGGTPPVERQHLRHVQATSDAAGYFTLPPLHRVAAIQLRVSAPPLAPVDLLVHPVFGQPENWLDVVFA